ncbi:Zc3h12a-like Ribonuclease NYN [Gracilaria domingensis]|nr:Zc3h12a-like Ribonuclease NYN [Gracilaria domingensis]
MASERECYDVIIDGLDVGTDYERNREFRFERVERALEYYETRGRRVVAAIPDNLVLTRNQTFQRDQLIGEGRLIVIEGRREFCGKHYEGLLWDLYIYTIFRRRCDPLDPNPRTVTQLVTNNRFRGIERTGNAPAQYMREMREHFIIPYIFRGDDFVPRPRCQCQSND